jgi:3-isopropylmalate/(R)-2-methylmalate dehydratase large subunit
MATGKAWFKVPAAIKFVLTGKPAKWISGKDIILHIIGMIGVDGALYKSMEFVGDGISYLSMDDRFTIANMAIEAGGKNGIFPVDDLAKEYMEAHSKRPYVVYEADEDAEYEETYTIDLSTLKPTVAFPHLPENTKTIDEVGDIKIDQVVIGSCTNGRIEDMEAAYNVLKGKHIAKGVRGIIIPATMAVYKECILRGYTEAFIDAGCIVSTAIVAGMMMPRTPLAMCLPFRISEAASMSSMRPFVQEPITIWSILMSLPSFARWVFSGRCG